MTLSRIAFVAALALGATATPLAASDAGPIPVRAGSATTVLSYASYDPSTCYYGALPTLRVVKAPAHGTLVFGKEKRLPSPGTCAGRTFTAATAVYHSSGGFRGRDEMVVEASYAIYTDGTSTRSDQVHITVDVK